MYPGRASASPTLDLFMTLLHWGTLGAAAPAARACTLGRPAAASAVAGTELLVLRRCDNKCQSAGERFVCKNNAVICPYRCRLTMRHPQIHELVQSRELRALLTAPPGRRLAGPVAAAGAPVPVPQGGAAAIRAKPRCVETLYFSRASVLCCR